MSSILPRKICERALARCQVCACVNCPCLDVNAYFLICARVSYDTNNKASFFHFQDQHQVSKVKRRSRLCAGRTCDFRLEGKIGKSTLFDLLGLRGLSISLSAKVAWQFLTNASMLRKEIV